MSYAILRTAKLKSFGEIGGSLIHTYRDQPTPNADLARQDFNIHEFETREQAMNSIREAIPEKRRKDAVLCIEHLITYSPDANFSDEQANNYFIDAVQWLNAKYGQNNVRSVHVHNDETTPHMIAYVVPVDPDSGRLNAKKWLGDRKKLSDMQTDFANQVGEKHGLERGIRKSKANHKTIREYYSEVNTMKNPDLPEPLPKPNPYELNIPDKAFLQSKSDYDRKLMTTCFEFCESYQKQVYEQYNELHYASKKLKEKLEEKEEELENLKRRSKPYFMGIRNLSADEFQQFESDLNNGNIKDRFLQERRLKHERDSSLNERELHLKSRLELLDQKYENLGLDPYRAFEKTDQYVNSLIASKGLDREMVCRGFLHHKPTMWADFLTQFKQIHGYDLTSSSEVMEVMHICKANPTVSNILQFKADVNTNLIHLEASASGFNKVMAELAEKYPSKFTDNELKGFDEVFRQDRLHVDLAAHRCCQLLYAIDKTERKPDICFKLDYSLTSRIEKTEADYTMRKTEEENRKSFEASFNPY